MNERRLGRFTEWFRRRPNALEFWEVFVTSERLVWCFAGESFSSALLRADTGEQRRAALDDATIEEALAADERNFAVPIDALDRLELVRGTRFRRARLEIAWAEDGLEESITLYNTKTGDAQEELVASLADDARFAGVSIGIEPPASFFRRS